MGSHYVGPTWMATDGSYVVGRRVDGVNMDPTAIDWLLLAKDTSAPGADGDRLAATTYVQRVNTTGGRAPAATECDVAGETAEIPYAADYYFWKATDYAGAQCGSGEIMNRPAATRWPRRSSSRCSSTMRPEPPVSGACSIRPRPVTKPTW